MKLQRFMQAPAQLCRAEETLAAAARRMEIHNVGSLVVADGTQHIIGIVTDRDLALALAHGKGADTPVSDVMPEDVVTGSEATALDDAAATMDSITGSFPAGLAEMAPACGLVCSMTTCARGTSPLDWANRKNSEL